MNENNKKKTTQRKRVLNYLKDYHSITAKDAIELFGCMRLSAVIFDLKKLGCNIITSMETSKNRYGEPVRYARYILEES